MNRMCAGYAVIVVGLCASMASAQTPTPSADQRPESVNQRLENQHDRIQAGIKDGELTKGEATQLRGDDAAIRARERVDRKANDGKLTRHERTQLNRELNRSSKQIYRDRHNRRKPK